MDRHDRQLFYRLQQAFHLRAVHQAVGDLVQHRAVVLAEPENQVGEQHIGKPAEHVQFLACHKFAVFDLPIGDVVLQRAELVLVFHHGVIIVMRQKHPDKRRMRHQMAIARKQLVIDAGVIEPIIAKARAVVVVKADDAVPNLLIGCQRSIKRNVSSLAVAADDDVAVKLRGNVFQILLRQWIRLHPALNEDVEILMPAGQRIIGTAKYNDHCAVRQQEGANAILQRRLLGERALHTHHPQRGKPRRLRHAHHVNARLLGQQQTHPAVSAALLLKVRVCHIGKGNRCAAKVR